jgi:predicted permease
MRGTRVTSQRHRLHGALVLAQLALAAVLLVGGGLLSRTLANLDAVDPGFRADGILTVRVAPPFERFLAGRQGMLVGEAGEFDAAGYDRYHADLAAALAAVPGVQGVARTSILPFSGDRSNNDIEPEGYVPAPGEKLLAERNIVSANYMDLVGMRLLEGRGFSAADDRADAAPVLMVTQNLARHYWPGASAVGRQIKFFRGTFTVIGVIADVRDRALDIAEEERMYIPAGQWSGIGGSYVLRASPGVDPASLAAAVREQIRGVDPDLPVTSILALRDRIESSLAEYRYRARLMSAFALLALLFAALGIYGVTRRAVASRTREIGIRMALGARRTGVVGMVIRQGAVLALLGGLLGVLAGVAAGRALATFVYGVGTADPVTLLAVALGLPLFGVLASLAPSLRAARVDPVVALRGE